jgi:hypothetical protein
VNGARYLMDYAPPARPLPLEKLLEILLADWHSRRAWRHGRGRSRAATRRRTERWTA